MPRDVLPTELILTPEPSPLKLILNYISILFKKRVLFTENIC